MTFTADQITLIEDTVEKITKEHEAVTSLMTQVIKEGKNCRVCLGISLVEKTTADFINLTDDCMGDDGSAFVWQMMDMAVAQMTLGSDFPRLGEASRISNNISATGRYEPLGDDAVTLSAYLYDVIAGAARGHTTHSSRTAAVEDLENKFSETSAAAMQMIGRAALACTTTDMTASGLLSTAVSAYAGILKDTLLTYRKCEGVDEAEVLHILIRGYFYAVSAYKGKPPKSHIIEVLSDMIKAAGKLKPRPVPEGMTIAEAYLKDEDPEGYAKAQQSYDFGKWKH